MIYIGVEDMLEFQRMSPFVYHWSPEIDNYDQ